MRSAACLGYQMVYCSKYEAVGTWILSFASVLCLMLALGIKIWLGINATSLGYQLAEERDRAVAYDNQRRELELQLSVLLRPDNLSQRAAKVLGMQAMSPQQARTITY